MSTEISYGEKQKRYQSLVREAWDKYQQGDNSQMASLLEQSLEYTPYLRAETVSDWINQFAKLAKQGEDIFDIDILSSLQQWDKVLDQFLSTQKSKQQTNIIYLSAQNTQEGNKNIPKQNDFSEEKVKTLETKASFKTDYEKLLNDARKIPRSNGVRYYQKLPLKVGIIADIYMYNFYKDVFGEVYYLSPDNYREVLDSNLLDIIIYTTCWKGMKNEEWKGVKFRKKPELALSEIIRISRERNTKIVFQSIEDPSNFEYFLPIARKFDYIFTTDIDSVDAYKKCCEHDRVFYGEYGVNPEVNNPIGCRNNIRNAVFFAGSYPKRYEERSKDMETIFDSLLNSGCELVVADRNYGTKSPDLKYPERFESCIIPPIDHLLLQSVHKLFRYNLNFNSIKNSPTMCAMRVYELQAQGSGLISSYARSVFNNFPGIRIVPYLEDMSFDSKYPETWEEYRAKMANVRSVLTDKTSYDVVTRLVNNLDFTEIEINQPTVCVIFSAKTNKLLESFNRQKYKKLILISEESLRSNVQWNEYCNLHNIQYFCWFSSDDEYEENYLIDMLNGFKFTNSKYITKCAYFEQGMFYDGWQHQYVSEFNGKSRTLFSADEFSPLELIEYSLKERVVCGRGYSIDPFELNYLDFVERTKPLQKAQYQLSVIVPVYNNGRFLATKCIPSLTRNKLWPEIEVLLVDDGSTDKDTIQHCKNLARIHSNVKTFFNPTGGSGSASRPRNQGIEMATAPLMSFLDPDNEISPGGYDTLFELYQDINRDHPDRKVCFVSGYHVKVGATIKIIGKHTPKRVSVIEDFQTNYFKKNRFPLISTQAAVISRKLFENPNLRFIEKALGQDTLFGWELLCQAKRGVFTGDAYLIYYSERSNSVTNLIGKDYFEKKLILETEQYSMLLRYGILQNYLSERFDTFMKDWYLPKISSVKINDREACLNILRQIANLYGRDLSSYLA